MEEPLQRQIEKLRGINVALRRRLEWAETYIPQINDQLAQLGRLDLMTGMIELGEIVYRRAYNPEADCGDSEQIYQAAISVPEGLCLVLWDMNEFVDAGQHPLEMERRARTKIVSYDQCSPGLKALLLNQASILVERLFHQIAFAEAQPPVTDAAGGTS